MRIRRQKPKASFDAEIVRFAIFFGVPFVSALSLLGGIAVSLLAGT